MYKKIKGNITIPRIIIYTISVIIILGFLLTIAAAYINSYSKYHFGKVTEISVNQITVENPVGVISIAKLGPNTKIIGKNNSKFNKLEVNDKVIIIGKVDSFGTIDAKAVKVIK